MSKPIVPIFKRKKSDSKAIGIVSNLFNTVYKTLRFILKNSAKIITLGLAAQVLFSRANTLTEADQNGMTPLHLAAEAGDLPAVRKFVTEGADIYAENNKGQTALDIVCSILEKSMLNEYEDLICVPLENHLPGHENYMPMVKYLNSQGLNSFCTLFNPKEEELVSIQEATSTQRLRS